MIGYLESVSVKNKTYKLDFKDCFAVNLAVDKNGVYDGYGLTEIAKVFKLTNAVAVYNADNKYFIYCNDGSVYQVTAISRVYMGNAGGSPPRLISVLSGNTVKYLFVGKNSFYINGAAVDIPAASVATLHNGRLFTANGRVVTFSKPVDFENNSVSLTPYGTLGVCERAGNVVGFYSDSDKLAIICEHAIYNLTAFGESIDFNFERLNISALDVKANSIVCFNDGCIFLSGEKLYKYSNGKITVQETLLNNFNFTVCGSAAQKDGIYLLPVTVNGENYIYALNNMDGRESFIATTSAIIADGGLILSGGVVNKLTDSGFMGERILSTNPIDFGISGVKTVCVISASVGADCTLKVKGDFGEKRYSLKTGGNIIKTNLKSQAFTFSLSSANGFTVKNFNVKYRLKGE